MNIKNQWHLVFNKPLELREATGLLTKYDKLGVFEAQEKLLEIAFAIEEGRRISRDIGGSDPERMSAPNIADFIQSEFGHVPNVSVKVDNVTTKEYPLMAAVNRGAARKSTHKYLPRFISFVFFGTIDK